MSLCLTIPDCQFVYITTPSGEKIQITVESLSGRQTKMWFECDKSIRIEADRDGSRTEEWIRLEKLKEAK